MVNTSVSYQLALPGAVDSLNQFCSGQGGLILLKKTKLLMKDRQQCPKEMYNQEGHYEDGHVHRLVPDSLLLGTI